MSHKEMRIYHTPGRTEIIGNHSDHQHGCIIAATIDRCIRAEVTPRDDGQIMLASEGHRPIHIDMRDTALREQEKNHSPSLVRGMAHYLQEHGCRLRGFEARTTSTVPSGSGLSSSAAFEILVGRIMMDLAGAGDELTHEEEAVFVSKAGVFAENEYYGKPCGMMDQLAIACGGMSLIDFADPDNPRITPLAFEPEAYGYQLILVQTGTSHADDEKDFAAIPQEMWQVANYFGEAVLRDVAPERFAAEKEAVREALGARPVLRAEHFFEEQVRVRGAADAIRTQDIERFLEYVNASGRSSEEKLQNIIPDNGDRSFAEALALSRRTLGGRGASRVHGGGFGGTIQAYVPVDMLSMYTQKMEESYGAGACLRVNIM